MKPSLIIFLLLSLRLCASESPFTPLPPGDGYGFNGMAWRFASKLTAESSGVIEVCYEEVGAPTRTLVRLPLSPYYSSDTNSPELRVLLTKVQDGQTKKIVILIACGLRSATFVAEVPGLTSHSLVGNGGPIANGSGEISLLAFGESVGSSRDGFTEARGRLYLRYLPQN